ncbi:uncharacterized protein TRAVEDRAFT_28783 [Trametes versicolor FP-101664 SS1]|uniref:uncharacterized protein n=1 Tax=Trametes versicolor (strain FP-101664) TaxID=717944 RepID=UPI000462439A|nr:uncharacterized protein TRAVEDRAFT_28783 [Trametes versicolor FP-101664 SS1]EIW59764.1 hypothetical protein TRAVEDRAFT_28783 [Trametes versicolor FP-101664 SS1]
MTCCLLILEARKRAYRKDGASTAHHAEHMLEWPVLRNASAMQRDVLPRLVYRQWNV